MKRPTPTPHRPRQDSWLSLIGETAGVGGCGVTRVAFTAPSEAEEWRGQGEIPTRRVLVQVRDDGGAVLGAASWSGGVDELLMGAQVDVGFCSDASRAHHVTVWMEADDALPRTLPSEQATDTLWDPFSAAPPSWATHRAVNDASPVELHLPAHAA